MDKDFQEILSHARRLGACEKIDKAVSWDSLIEMFFTPYGIEFMENTAFPTLSQFRKQKERLEEVKIYVDEKNVELYNEHKVGILGDATATLIYDGVDELNTVVVRDGADAKIKASNYAVVKVYNLGGNVDISTDETAKIL